MIRTRFVALAILAAAPVGAQAPTPISVTLFNSGLVLIRQTLPVQLPAGEATRTVPLGILEPSSLAALDPGVTITSVRFDPGSSEEALLRRNIGHVFTFRRDTGTITARLLAVSPERWSLSDGHVAFSRPGQILWPPELVPLEPVTDIGFQSDRARTSARVMYQTRGGSWDASYRLYLGAAGRIEGVAEVQGGTLTAANAEVQLLAGDIGAARVAPRDAMAGRVLAMEAAAPSKAASQTAVGEAHVYTLPERVTFIPGTRLALPLFEPAPVKAERRFWVGGSLSMYGDPGRQEDEQDVPVEVGYYLARKVGTIFGDLPLPAGAVSVFDADREGRMQLIGMSVIEHTAPGKALLISTGTAFDVTATRVQTEYSTTRSGTPVRTTAMVGYRVTLQNAKDSSVVVEVREDRSGEWSVVRSSIPAQRRSSDRVVFPVTIPAKGSATVTYTLRVVW